MDNPTQPWVWFMDQYGVMMVDHHTDIGLYPVIHEDHENRVEWAIDYVTTQGDYEYYPGKKMMTSLIWAVLAHHVYGTPLLEALDDPTLILEQDRMVRYSSDPTGYHEILERLEIDPDMDAIPVDFILEGWGPWSAFYFWVECTQEGYEAVIQHHVDGTLDQLTPENYHERICTLLQRPLPWT